MKQNIYYRTNILNYKVYFNYNRFDVPNKLLITSIKV